MRFCITRMCERRSYPGWQENVETFFFLFWRKADDRTRRIRRCSTDDAAAFVQLRPAEDSDRLILFYLEAMKPRIPEKWHARKLPGSGRTDALPFSWLAKFRLLRS